MPLYHALEPNEIVETICALKGRIDKRFPDSGLGQVCQRLLEIGDSSKARATWIAEPIISLRVGSAFLIALIIAGIYIAVSSIEFAPDRLDFVAFVQVMESAVNDIFFVGVAVFFLLTVEARIKRHRALKSLHELRALAHIIDMHQLTKDPEQVLSRDDDPEVPDRVLSAYQLGRYLDYCTEMLAVIGKIAALYVQRFHDSVALAAVNEVENLTNGLSRKIWQKLMILYSIQQKAA